MDAPQQVIQCGVPGVAASQLHCFEDESHYWVRGPPDLVQHLLHTSVVQGKCLASAEQVEVGLERAEDCSLLVITEAWSEEGCCALWVAVGVVDHRTSPRAHQQQSELHRLVHQVRATGERKLYCIRRTVEGVVDDAEDLSLPAPDGEEGEVSKSLGWCLHYLRSVGEEATASRGYDAESVEVLDVRSTKPARGRSDSAIFRLPEHREARAQWKCVCEVVRVKLCV